jgi:hypothetical protein
VTPLVTRDGVDPRPHEHLEQSAQLPSSHVDALVRVSSAFQAGYAGSIPARGWQSGRGTPRRADTACPGEAYVKLSAAISLLGYPRNEPAVHAVVGDLLHLFVGRLCG